MDDYNSYENFTIEGMDTEVQKPQKPQKAKEPLPQKKKTGRPRKNPDKPPKKPIIPPDPEKQAMKEARRLAQQKKDKALKELRKEAEIQVQALEQTGNANTALAPLAPMIEQMSAAIAQLQKDNAMLRKELGVAQGLMKMAQNSPAKAKLEFGEDEPDTIGEFNNMIRKLPSLQNRRDPQEVSDRFDTYFQLCSQYQQRPTIAGLALAIGISRKQFLEWRTGLTKVPDDLREVIAKAEAIVTANLEGYMTRGKINPVSGIFLLKQVGYTDEQKLIVAPERSDEGMSEEELQKKYLDSIPTVDD